MERTVFYYKYNRLLLKYTPLLLFGLCLFWSLLDILTDDSMYFLKTGAIFGVGGMALMSCLSFLVFIRTDKVFNQKTEEKQIVEKHFSLCKAVTLLFFISIILGSASVCGANNYVISVSGAASTFQTISLSSALLFIPVLIPFPEKKYDYILIGAILLSSGIPLLMKGKECYSFLPELVLRIAICIALLVVSRKSDENYKLEMKIKRGNTKILSMLVNLIEMRDLESGRHVNRVRDYTKIMLEKIRAEYPEYGLTPRTIQIIADASSTHDIGKILIPDSILLKPGQLSDEEFKIMQTHTAKGKDILMSLPDELIEPEFLRYSFDICEYHHEKYDGNGYFGLKGEEIPIWAQVVSVIDCYEALTSKRHYKEAYSHETAVKMILNGECGQFSERIIRCFLDCLEDFRKIE